MKKKRTLWGKIKLSLVLAIVGIAAAVAAAVLFLLPGQTPARPPVILISIDTLRADHLGVYGYHRNTSPHIDRLAEKGIVFTHAYAQSPNTIISHATMLTSLYPMVHGVTPEYRLAPEIETVAEYFQEQGYKTGGFTTHGAWLNEEMGFAQGFDDFFSRFVSGDNINSRVFAFLDEHGHRDFFLFVHYYDPHSDHYKLPYDTRTHFDRTFCPDYRGSFTGCRENLCASQLLKRLNETGQPLPAEDRQYIMDLYDGGILYTDFQLGRLFKKLKELDVYDKALILITADHGEEFREHGQFLHNQLYNEVMRVPLIIKPPGSRPQVRKNSPVGVIDIVPTLLEFAHIRYEDDHLQGRSLWPQIEGSEPGERIVFSTLKGVELSQADHLSLRDRTFSFHTWEKFSQFKLFNIKTDPGETRDILDPEDETLEKFLRLARNQYRSQLKLRNRFKYKRTGVKQSRENLEKLKSLGYLK